MGTFYGSILVRSEDTEAIKNALVAMANQEGCKFLLGPPINGWSSLFPNESGQNEAVSAELARVLPNDIFHLIVHDDDVFAYFYYRDGKLIDQYNSCPDYFEEVTEAERQASRGRPELLQPLISNEETLNELKTLLTAAKDEYVFEQERMEKFTKLLGLSNSLSSYEYLQAGERDGIQGWKNFLHIPDQAAEKEAKRIAQKRIKEEKKLLQKEGILLAEIEAPREKGAGLPPAIAWTTEPEKNGMLLSFASHRGAQIKELVDLLSVAPPWNEAPKPFLLTNWTACVYAVSPSGRWLAGGFAYGDWMMRVWDCERKTIEFEVSHTGAVVWVEFSADEQSIYSLGGDELIVSSISDKRAVSTIKGMKGATRAAVHPASNYVAIGFQDRLGIVDVSRKQLIKRLWINRKTEIMDPFVGATAKAFIGACLKGILEEPEFTKQFGISNELGKAILAEPTRVAELSPHAQTALNSILEEARKSMCVSFESKEHLFDMLFHPSGEQLFVASSGMRVFRWAQLLTADGDAPAPEMSVDAPRDDENNPNSRPLCYSICFDRARNLLISSCFAGVIQFLHLGNGRSGTLLQPPGELTIWRLELTKDGETLCCHVGTRPTCENKRVRSALQIWNYRALCRRAGLD
jgi:hypothetical protein